MNWKKYVLGLLIFTVSFLAVNLRVMDQFMIGSLPIDSVNTFAPNLRTTYRVEIQEKQPEVVAIGDSAIRKYSEPVFSLNSGMDTLIFSAPGSGSVYWYSFFRNQVLPASQSVRYVLFFFRDTTLTVPEFLVKGEYLVRLEEVAGAKDRDIYEIAINNRKSSLVRWLENYVPMYAMRSDIYFKMTQAFRNILPEMIVACDANCVNMAFDTIFDMLQLNSLLWEEQFLIVNDILYTDAQLDFSAQAADSFLPMMIEDAATHNITPVFVRVKYRSHAEGEQDDPLLAQYLDDLADYVEEEGGVYVDLSKDDQIKAEMYDDGVHINTQFAPFVTRVVAKEITQALDDLQ